MMNRSTQSLLSDWSGATPGPSIDLRMLAKPLKRIMREIQAESLVADLKYRRCSAVNTLQTIHVFMESCEIGERAKNRVRQGFLDVCADSQAVSSWYHDEPSEADSHCSDPSFSPDPPAMTEAIAFCRSIAATHLRQFNWPLIQSFVNLSSHLWCLNRQNEAIDVINESLTLSRRLLSSSVSVRFNSDGAQSLIMISGNLKYFGRVEEAFDVFNEAVAIYHLLAAPDPSSPRLPSSQTPRSALSVIHLSLKSGNCVTYKINF